MADVVVLGAGYWGQKLIRALREVEGVDRICCVDPRPEARHDLERRFGRVQVFDREGDLLDDPAIRAAVVAAPAATHYALAKRWIMAGKHVLVEKPVALDVPSARDLTSMAEQMGVAIVPGHTYHFTGAEEYLRGYVRAGALGDPLWLQSERMNLGRFRRDVSVLWDLGPHDATVLVDLLDPEIVSCRALGSPQSQGTLDTCCVTMRTEQKTAVTWLLSWRSPEKVRRIAIIGTRCTVLWDDLDASWPLRIYRTDLRRVVDAHGQEEILGRVGDVTLPEVDHREPLRKECEHFIDVVNGIAEPQMDGRHIMKVTAMLARAEADIGSP